MSVGILNTLARFRQPEYTGENRCTPCTVLNILIASVLAVIIGVTTDSIAAGVIIFVGAGVLIYLRGYLVPGTPTITQEYFPERVLRWFDKETESATGDGLAENVADRDGADDTAILLVTAGIVEGCSDDDDLCLTDRFAEVWWRRIRQVRDDDRAVDRLAAVLELDPDELTIEEGDQGVDVVFDGATIGRWTSRAAFLADLAVEPTLAEWLPDWEGLGDRTRTELIAGMRAFLEECPSCEAELEPVENVRQSCCSSRVVGVDVDCPACGARVFSGRYR